MPQCYREITGVWVGDLLLLWRDAQRVPLDPGAQPPHLLTPLPQEAQA
jgi:hypothetical protein